MPGLRLRVRFVMLHLVVLSGMLFVRDSCGNPLEERLLDQAQGFLGGHSRIIPQGMIFDVQPLVQSLFCPKIDPPMDFLILGPLSPERREVWTEEVEIQGVSLLGMAKGILKTPQCRLPTPTSAVGHASEHRQVPV